MAITFSGLTITGGGLTAVPPPTVPGAPTIGTATATSATTATVAFTQPTNDGGAAITSYTATSSPGGITGTLNQAGSGTITVSGLTAGTAYTFTVTATNSVGTSAASAASNSITPPVPVQKVFVFGYNNWGQLGLNDQTSRSSPVQLGSNGSTWSVFSANPSAINNAHNAGVKQDGILWTWGNNASYGQLGLGDKVNRSSPTQVGSDTNWNKVNDGNAHKVAVKTDGTMWSWGNNTTGQLGQGPSNGSIYQLNCSSPVQVGALTNWSNVACGASHTLALKTNGTLWSFGYNSYGGALGLGDTANRYSPVQVGAGTNWSKISAGAYHSAAIKSDGTLWLWGYNGYGNLGDGTTTNRSSPVQIGSDTNWSLVSAGSYFTVAIKTNGTLWSFGNNGSGQLGLGDTTNRSSPTQVGAGTNWSLVKTGTYHTVALKTDGTLWSFGYNNRGQLGLNDQTPRSSPTQIGGYSDWSSVYVSSASTTIVELTV